MVWARRERCAQGASTAKEMWTMVAVGQTMRLRAERGLWATLTRRTLTVVALCVVRVEARIGTEVCEWGGAARRRWRRRRGWREEWTGAAVDAVTAEPAAQMDMQEVRHAGATHKPTAKKQA